MEHVIFPAGPDDALALAETHVGAWRETYLGMIADSYLDRMNLAAHARRFHGQLIARDEHSLTLAAAGRDGIVAYVGGGPSRIRRRGEAEIHTLYVRRRAQGRGLGRRLLIAAATAFADMGATTLLISTLRDNGPARAFYEHLGGRAQSPRQEPGPSGLVYEVSYIWTDIKTLIC